MLFPTSGILQRIIISLIIAFCIYGAFSIFQINEWKANYQSSISEYESIATAQEREVFCERIQKGLVPSPETTNCNKKDFENIYDELITKDICEQVKKGDKESLLKSYGCIFDPESAGEIGKPANNFISYVWYKYRIRFMQSTLITGAIIYGIWSLLISFLNESSQGWKRLSLVLSFTISLLIAFLFYRDAHINATNIALIAFLIGLPSNLIVLIMGKKIYCWVINGFAYDRGEIKKKQRAE